MKFSEAWLREFVNPDLSTQELVDQLTMAGLEVDGFEPVAAEFSNVVVGEILEGATDETETSRRLRVEGFQGPDYIEGRDAFLEKREATFTYR